jgi:hypothetical protein
MKIASRRTPLLRVGRLFQRDQTDGRNRGFSLNAANNESTFHIVDSSVDLRDLDSI